MEKYSIGKIYTDVKGMKTIDINPMPENYCSFDCVFCPLGRTIVKTEKTFYFNETREFINRLSTFLELNYVDTVFINPDGEALANGELLNIVKVIKNKNKRVKLLTNGYILNREEYKEVLKSCDVVIGELAVTKEEDFQKLIRPLDGYTLKEYVYNMANFKKWFEGKFILDITIIRNYSDNNEAIEGFKEMIKNIKPDEIFLETPDEKRLKGAFKVSEERLEEMKKALNNNYCL